MNRTKRRTLILVDVQNDFVTGPLGTKEAQAAIPNIKKLIKDMTDEDGDTLRIPTTRETILIPWRARNCLSSIAVTIPAAGRLSRRSPTTHCTIFKNTFGTEDIGDMVLDHIYPNPLEEIHICGFCVAANAVILRAQFPNTPIYIHADACAGVTPEAHNAALTVFAAQQMEVVR